MSMIAALMENHPIRKSKAQKEDFREWFLERAQEMGYTAAVEKKGSSHNVVVGDPETAQVTFTAHYDTPAVMPIPNFITPKNILFYILYNMLVVALFFVAVGLVSFVLGYLTRDPSLAAFGGMMVYFVLLYLMMFGPANKNCWNDNSSGVAAVMELMNRLPENQRQKAAFILFDNEEKGLLGSSAYAKMHKKVKKEKLLINMDCVGDGENMLFFANKKTRALPEYRHLENALYMQEGRKLMMEKMETSIYPSDQAHFKLGMAVCACKRKKVLGYYMDRIHTKKDTVCEQANLDFLSQGLSRFVERL